MDTYVSKHIIKHIHITCHSFLEPQLKHLALLLCRNHCSEDWDVNPSTLCFFFMAQFMGSCVGKLYLNLWEAVFYLWLNDFPVYPSLFHVVSHLFDIMENTGATIDT